MWDTRVLGRGILDRMFCPILDLRSARRILFRAPRFLGLLGLAALAVSCSDGEPVVTMPIERILADVATVPEMRTVQVENPDHPVEARTLAPSAYRQFDAAGLPSLELVPPARVTLDLSEMDPRGELRFAVGHDATAFTGEDKGVVRYRVLDGEKVLFEALRPFGPETRPIEQSWKRGSLPIAGLDQVVLETALVGGGDAAPEAGFGSIQVVVDEARARERASSDHPNVIVVVIDTLRADRLSGHGYDKPTSPNIDALARRGTQFDSAWSAAPWTWPSTASLLTTLSPPEHGLTDHNSCYLSETLDTISECLQQEGWTTGGFSSNPLVHSGKGFAQGFETFEEFTWARANGVMKKVEPWLRENAKWRFFMYVHLSDPHEYRPREVFSKQFQTPKPEGYSLARLRTNYARSLTGESHNLGLLQADVEYLSSIYDATIAESDDAVGQISLLLEELGRTEDTIVVVTSDHGEAFLEHDFLYHSAILHDEMVHVPLVIAGPGVPQGVRIAERVENRFLAPTLLGKVHVDPLGRIQGPDLLDEAARAEAAAEPFFFTTSKGSWAKIGEHEAVMRVPMHGVRTQTELFYTSPDLDRPSRHLFDLVQDPGAHKDLSAERPERCDELARMIRTWIEKGTANSPLVLDGGQSALDLLRANGYAGDD